MLDRYEALIGSSLFERGNLRGPGSEVARWMLVVAAEHLRQELRGLDLSGSMVKLAAELRLVGIELRRVLVTELRPARGRRRAALSAGDRVKLSDRLALLERAVAALACSPDSARDGFRCAATHVPWFLAGQRTSRIQAGAAFKRIVALVKARHTRPLTADDLSSKSTLVDMSVRTGSKGHETRMEGLAAVPSACACPQATTVSGVDGTAHRPAPESTADVTVLRAREPSAANPEPMTAATFVRSASALSMWAGLAARLIADDEAVTREPFTARGNLSVLVRHLLEDQRKRQCSRREVRSREVRDYVRGFEQLRAAELLVVKALTWTEAGTLASTGRTTCIDGRDGGIWSRPSHLDLLGGRRHPDAVLLGIVTPPETRACSQAMQACLRRRGVVAPEALGHGEAQAIRARLWTRAQTDMPSLGELRLLAGLPLAPTDPAAYTNAVADLDEDLEQNRRADRAEFSARLRFGALAMVDLTELAMLPAANGDPDVLIIEDHEVEPREPVTEADLEAIWEGPAGLHQPDQLEAKLWLRHEVELRTLAADEPPNPAQLAAQAKRERRANRRR